MDIWEDEIDSAKIQMRESKLIHILATTNYTPVKMEIAWSRASSQNWWREESAKSCINLLCELEKVDKKLASQLFPTTMGTPSNGRSVCHGNRPQQVRIVKGGWHGWREKAPNTICFNEGLGHHPQTCLRLRSHPLLMLIFWEDGRCAGGDGLGHGSVTLIMPSQP